MKNKKLIVSLTIAAVSALSISAAAFAADTTDASSYSYISGRINGLKYANAEGGTDDGTFAFHLGKDKNANHSKSDPTDESDYSYQKGLSENNVE